MKTSLLSVVAAFALLVSTAASAASGYDHSHDNDRRVTDTRRMTTADRARYEAAQRENDRKLAQERARYEEAQRKQQRENDRRVAQEQRTRLEAQRREDQRKAAERARYEAQHRNDRHDDRGRDYGYNGR